MPEFMPGESKTAIAPITVKPAGLNCEAEIFLGPNDLTKVATSGLIAFTSIGVGQNVHLPVTMPSAEGTYHVYVDVYVEGLLIAAYQAIEDVSIAAGMANIWMDPHLYFVGTEPAPGGYYVYFRTRIENRGAGPGTRWMQYSGSSNTGPIGYRCAFPVGTDYLACTMCPNPNLGNYYPLTLNPGEAVDFEFRIYCDPSWGAVRLYISLYCQEEVCGLVGDRSYGTFNQGQAPETYPYPAYDSFAIKSIRADTWMSGYYLYFYLYVTVKNYGTGSGSRRIAALFTNPVGETLAFSNGNSNAATEGSIHEVLFLGAGEEVEFCLRKSTNFNEVCMFSINKQYTSYLDACVRVLADSDWYNYISEATLRVQ